MFHLRVSISAIAADARLVKDGEVLTFVNALIHKFKPLKYVFAYECAKKVNHHIHAHLEYEAEPKKSTLSDFMKVHHFSGLYYHKNVQTTARQNLLYCIKDLNIIQHNFEKIEYDELVNTTEKINEDKATDQRDKLYNKFIESVYPSALVEHQKWVNHYNNEDIINRHSPNAPKPPLQWSLGWVAHWISEIYVKEYKKAPPLCHLNEYVLYIAHKVNELIGSDVYRLEHFYCKRFGETMYDSI